ncbi:TlpA family protein disulfide reductase [Alcaligenaceae bacterium]|nr:TlpA family protein disulfide reductase [Alcaligenaceae bacterium]
MSQGVTLGPLSLPFSVLLLVVSAILALLLARRIAGSARAQVEGLLYRGLLLGLFASRLAFVAQYFDAYSRHPLSMLDIRDGGWQPWAGLVAVWVYVMWLAWRAKPLRKAMLAGVMTFTVVWLAGTLLVGVEQQQARALPEFSATLMGGGQVALQSYAGKPTVINLWASWCPPCRREMPVFEQVQKERPEINIVMLNQGESAEQVQQFLQANKLELREVLLDARGDVAKSFGQRGLPATLFFDANGRLMDMRLGELSYATLTHRINAVAP